MMWTLDDIQNLRIPGLDDVAGQVRDLLRVHRDRYELNAKRSLYCDTEQAFKDLGIALPPQLKETKYVLGWAGQAVKKPAMRSQLDGLRLPGVEDPFELGELLDQNRFSLEFGQAVHAANKHGVALVTVSKGGPGEPAVQIVAHSVEASAAIWDRRTRRLKSALTITDLDLDGNPTGFVVWLADRIVTCTKDGGAWSSETAPNPAGRVPVVPVVNAPDLDSPLGRSRLTRSVMVLNDMAVRTMARMEANAEFYSSPQIALLGADYEAFYGDHPMSDTEKFKLAMDRVLAITKDEDGDAPTLQQLSQASMTPHSDMIRTLATAFAGETGIPPSSLGVIQDNPSSAEAIRAAEHDLLIDVTNQNQNVLPWAVKEIAALAVMTRDGLTEPPADAWKLSAHFRDPEFGSLWAEADAVQKLSASMGDLSQWPVLLERIFSEDEVARITADARKSAVSGLIGQIAQRVQADPAQVDQAVQNRGGVTGGGDQSVAGDGVPDAHGAGGAGVPN